MVPSTAKTIAITRATLTVDDNANTSFTSSDEPSSSLSFMHILGCHVRLSERDVFIQAIQVIHHYYTPSSTSTSTSHANDDSYSKLEDNAVDATDESVPYTNILLSSHTQLDTQFVTTSLYPITTHSRPQTRSPTMPVRETMPVHTGKRTIVSIDA